MSKSYSDIREALYKKATPDQVDIAEQTDEPASEDEAGMAMDQAKFIGYVAEEIMEYLQGNNDFPEWMQNKLTGLHEKAKDMHAVMAGKYESVQEAKFTDKQIKMAYGIANDKRYKGGNYTGAVRAIEKIAKGLSDHPDVKKVLKVTNESLRSDIAKLSAKFPEGSKVRMKHDGKVAKVVSVGKDFVKVAVGNKTMDHKPSELEKLNEANYQVKAGKAAIGSASYDDKEIVTITPQQAKKLTSYFQKNKDGDMWKKLFQGGGKGGKGAENQKDFDSMVAGLKESTELDEAAYKVPNNYAAMKARMNKGKKVTDAQINKVLGPTKNAQQGVEALKKAFKVTDDEAKAMIKQVMPTEETVAEATMYLIKMRDGSKHKKTLDSAAAEKMKKNPDVLSVSVIGNVAEESIEEKLKVSDGMGTWIKDFQDSDAPQFKGKSDKERRDMAIAAYMSAKRGGKETKESTKAYGKSMDDIKKKNISDKDKKTLGKLADLMAKERGKK